MSNELSGSKVYNTIADALEERKARQDRRVNKNSDHPHANPGNDRRSGKDRRDD